MMNKPNYRAGTGPGYRYNQSTKTTLQVEQILMEYANHHTGGNKSKLVRDIIDEWIAWLDAGKLSPKARLALREHEENQRQENLNMLARGYQRLQQNYSKEHEQDLKDFAEKYGLDYQPEDYQIPLWELDPNLSRTMNAVRTACNGTGQTTLRDIYRITGCPQEETLGYMQQLRDFGQVKFTDPQPYKSCTVELVNS